MFTGSLTRVAQPASNSSKAYRERNAGEVTQPTYAPVYVAELSSHMPAGSREG